MRTQAAILLIAFPLAGFAQRESAESVIESLATMGLAVASSLRRSFDALDPTAREALAPALVGWIESSRDHALERGTAEIPDDVRAALDGYVPREILDRARWRVDDSMLSVQQALFRMGYTPALTLDHVILFKTAADAASAPLWAHELFHVIQYADWGVDGFIDRYLADYEAVERDAAEFRWQWLKEQKASGLFAEPETSEP